MRKFVSSFNLKSVSQFLESYEKLLYRKIEVWLVAFIVIVGACATITFGWMVRYENTNEQGLGALGSFANSVASIPSLAYQIVVPPEKEVGKRLGNVQPQIRYFPDFEGFVEYDTDYEKDKILLVSSYSSEYGVSTVYLYDLQSKEKIHEWIPPIDEIHEATSFKGNVNESPEFAVNNKSNYRTQHPLLMDDGSVVFHSGNGPLVKIDACSNLVWTIDRTFHHSIEKGKDGNLYVPIVVTEPGSPTELMTNIHFVNPMREDAIAKISASGEILQVYSIKDALLKAGYFGLLYGVGEYTVDRFHLNDIQPIDVHDDFVRKGDLALSFRHLSTVLLYRPSTDEIVWLKTGPWFNQHDVDYHGDGKFTIFGNDYVLLKGSEDGVFPRNSSNIWIYDQKSGNAKIYLELDKYTTAATQGLHKLLSNGDVFVENANMGILMQTGKTGKKWAYVNSIGKDEIGAMHWSRYLDYDPSKLAWRKSVSCER